MLLGLKLSLGNGLRGEVPCGAVAGSGPRLLGVYLHSGVHRAHLLASLLVVGRDPLLLGVVSFHDGDPGGGVHGDVAKLVQYRHS